MPRKSVLLNYIEELKLEYTSLKQGKESLVVLLNEVEVPEYVYNSNAIENNTLTLEETEKILLQVDLERYASEREIYEAKNLARVMEYVQNSAPARELTHELIHTLHRMLIGNIREEIAGRYREGNEWVKVGNHIAVNPAEVLRRMDTLLVEVNGGVYPSFVERIARFHLEFEFVHPFVDGNGRIGRVLLNYLLIRNGYVPINIAFVNREEYYNAFQEYEKNQSTDGMVKLVSRALSESFYRRLAYLNASEIVTIQEYSKREKLPLNNLLNKSQRQTIPAFRERKKWKIGVVVEPKKSVSKSPFRF
jgi:Fic family protein